MDSLERVLNPPVRKLLPPPDTARVGEPGGVDSIPRLLV